MIEHTPHAIQLYMYRSVGHTQAFGHSAQLSLLIARGAADDLNLHRGFLGPKLLISIRSLVEQYSLFEIRKQIFEAVV